MPKKVNIINLQNKIKFDGFAYEKIAQKTLAIMKKPMAGLNLVFVDDETIRGLNFKYRKANKSTDVLSFNESGSVKGAFLGEVVISPERAKYQAKYFGNAFEKELALYVIHGILHLLGYDDELSKEKEALMNKTQNRILEKIWRAKH